MITKKDLMEARLEVKHRGKNMPDLLLASKDPKRDDYFYIVYKNEVVGSVYMCQKQWYIWYRSRKYRTKTASFTSALKEIEEDLCVA